MSYFVKPGTVIMKVDHQKLVRNFKTEYLTIIRDAVCNYQGITAEEFHRYSPEKAKMGKKQVNTQISTARQYFCYLVKMEYTPVLTLKATGAFIYPGYDHTTVRYGIQEAMNDIDTGYLSAHNLGQLKSLINAKLFDLWRLLQSQDMPEQGKTLLAS